MPTRADIATEEIPPIANLHEKSDFLMNLPPRYEWTSGGGNFLGSAAIRYYCWQRCACARNFTKANLTSSLFGTPVVRPSTDFWIEDNNKDMSMTLKQGEDETTPYRPGQSHGVSSGPEYREEPPHS
jgi:hypothetical protein